MDRTSLNWTLTGLPIVDGFVIEEDEINDLSSKSASRIKVSAQTKGLAIPALRRAASVYEAEGDNVKMAEAYELLAELGAL